MATSTNKNQTQTTTRSRRSPATRPVVPAPSREATARKLDIVPSETELDELEFENDPLLPMVARPNPQNEVARQAWLNRIQDLTEKRDTLIGRLDNGAAAIEKARAEGQDVTSWEDFWIVLLRNYETVCDNLRDVYAQGYN